MRGLKSYFLLQQAPSTPTKTTVHYPSQMLTSPLIWLTLAQLLCSHKMPPLSPQHSLRFVVTFGYGMGPMASAFVTKLFYAGQSVPLTDVLELSTVPTT